MIRKDFKCKRCGLCCLDEALTKRDMWLGGKLTWEQKQELLKERKKYPETKTGCLMVYFKGGLAACLLRVMFEVDCQDKNCVDYPNEERCLRETPLNNKGI